MRLDQFLRGRARKCRNAFDSSSDWLVGHGVADMGLAFTSHVSIGAGSSRVARCGAHVFSVGRNFILVERGGAVSVAKPLAAHCYAFVLAQRGCGQHHCRGHTCIFARRYLPMVRINGANFGVSALTDQQEAAAIMWVPGQLVYLIPAVVILFSALSSTRSQRAQQFKSIALPQFSISNRRSKRQIFDVLALPVIGAALKSARVRGAIRWVMLIGALAIIADGWFGPREASTNIAGTWTWTHWRGFAAITLVAGATWRA